MDYERPVLGIVFILIRARFVVVVCSSGHRYIELFLNSRDDMGVGQPGPPPPGRMGGAPMGAGGGAPRYQAPPPPQQQQTGWNDPRMQVCATQHCMKFSIAGGGLGCTPFPTRI